MPQFLALGECMVEMAPLQNGQFNRGFAGDTFNTAWYARKLLPPAWQVSFGSCVGQDGVSETMLDFMRSQAIDTAAIRQVPHRTVGLYMIALDHGERSFSYWRSHSAARLLAHDRDWLMQITQGVDFIYFSAITMAILDPQGREALCAAIQAARRAGAMVAFDTNVRPSLWENHDIMRQGVMDGAGVSDLLLCSVEEEESLFGAGKPQDSVKRYFNLGAQIVALKNGGNTVHVFHRDGQHLKLDPKFVAAPVDTTAAGDSFAAGFCAALAQGDDLKRAAQSAIAIATKVIAYPGALVPELF